MFNKSSDKETAQNPVDIDIAPAPRAVPETKTARAVVGASIVFKGDLSGEEDLEVQGRVEGTVELKNNNLLIGKQGSVKADVRAKVITVEGRVEGDVAGLERVIVRGSGDVRGNIVAPRVSLDDGAKFKGSIDMELKADKATGPQRLSNKAPERSQKPQEAAPQVKTA